MAAYSLKDRFDAPPKYLAIFDPGSYQYEQATPKPNKAPFLSNVPRKTLNTNMLWTQTIYDCRGPHRIYNISSLQDKLPRFPYEAFSEEDLKIMLCRCGIPCDCPVSETELKKEVICQGKVKRRLIKGFVPLTDLGDEGISVPGRNDLGFTKSFSGTQRRMMKVVVEDPQFYDARVHESTEFYRGCKWSHWTSKRANKLPDKWPGPADYSIGKRQPTKEEICAEKVREYKRKTCRQLRFIEMVQRQNVVDSRPGPSDYTPTMPKGTDMQFLGPKSDRFPISLYDAHPGPADYWVRRDFDPLPEIENFPHAVLPEPACFGMKAQRFLPKKEEGPSPASYDPSYNPCKYIRCSKAPFSSTSVRFKPDLKKESDDEEDMTESATEQTKSCPNPMWPFKSKTIRIKPLEKKLDESSPADFPQTNYKITRSPEYQYAAPFYSSEGRFQPWYNWIPVDNRLRNSNQAFLNLEKPKCNPAFNHGPLFRTKRFAEPSFIGPAPNEYNVNGGIETILQTHNKKLLDNIEKQHKFTWKPTIRPPCLNYEQKYALILQKCLALVQTDEDTASMKSSAKHKSKTDDIGKDTEEKKMLNYFLYSHQMQRPC